MRAARTTPPGRPTVTLSRRALFDPLTDFPARRPRSDISKCNSCRTAGRPIASRTARYRGCKPRTGPTRTLMTTDTRGTAPAGLFQQNIGSAQQGNAAPNRYLSSSKKQLVGGRGRSAFAIETSAPSPFPGPNMQHLAASRRWRSGIYLDLPRFRGGLRASMQRAGAKASAALQRIKAEMTA
jgi:hypothetical protein